MIVTSLWLSSCGSTTSEAPARSTTRRELEAKTLNEGESRDVALGSVTAPTVTESDGLDVQIIEGALHVRAPYGVSGRKTVTITATDTILTQPIDIKAAAWSPSVTWTDGPEAREHGALMFDKDNKRVILIGGSGYMPYGTPLADIWAWSLTDKKWSKPAVEGDVPPAAGSRRVAGNYLFGGYAEASAVNNDLYRVELGNPIRFKKLTTTIPARSLHAFVAGPDGFYVFGGASTKPLNDTWHLKIEGDNVTATQLAPELKPTPRYGFFFGGDEKRLVVFSGAQAFSTVKPAEDTWAFDFAARSWTQIAMDNAPKGRRNGCFVSDPTNHRLFVFGGTADAMTSEAGFYVLQDETWTKLERAGEPPLRSSGFGFFDPATGAANCGFGNTTKAVYADWTAFGPI
jgi:hypothetical protein